MKATLSLEPSDYFFVKFDGKGKGYTLSVVGGDNHPVHVSGVSPRQLAKLTVQIEKARTAAAEASVLEMFGASE